MKTHDKLLNVKGCEKCLLCVGRHQIVNFTAPPKLKRVKVMFIGEGPGRNEDRIGKPFRGPAGKLLRQLIAECGLDPEEDVAYGNTVRCRPPRDRAPKPVEFNECFPYLMDDLERVDPNIVVLLGNTALQVCHAKLSITKFRGHIFTAQKINRKAIATFHPAYILRNDSAYETLLSDIRKAIANCNDREIPEGMGEYVVCSTVDEVQELADYLKASPEFTFDLETESFNYLEDDILCASFAAEEGYAYVVPIRGQYKQKEVVIEKVSPKGKVTEKREMVWIRATTPIWSPRDEKRVKAILKDLFESPRGALMAAQNGKFDVHWMRSKLGINAPRFLFDTMLAYHLIHEERPHNLEHLRSMYTNMKQYDDDVKLWAPKKSDSYAQVPNEQLWYYAAADADCELRVKHVVERKLDEDYAPKKDGYRHPLTGAKNAGRWLLDNHAMPLSRVYARVEEKGVRIDMERLAELDAEYAANIVRVIAAMTEVVGEREMSKYVLTNVNDLRRLLFDRLVKDWKAYGIPASLKTEKPSTNTRSMMMLQKAFQEMPDKPAKGNKRFVKVRDRIVDVVSVLDLVLQLRRATKIKGSFLCGVGKQEGKGGLLKYLKSDKRIHSTFNIAGTETGRHSSSNPNNTNIPAEGSIRSLYTVPLKRFGDDEDFDFIEADYKQIELRVMAYLSGDPDFQAALQTEDVHNTVAEMLFGEKMEDVPKERAVGMRIKAKTFNFGLNYGRGANSIAADFGVSVEEAQALIDQYMNRFPGIGNYHKTQAVLVAKGRPAESVFGRRRRAGNLLLLQRYVKGRAYRIMYNHLKRQYVNMPIQGSASDVVSQAMIALGDYDGINWGTLCEVNKRLMRYYKCSERELPAIVLLEEYRTHMIGSCHDAILFESPKQHSKEAEALIKKTMEDVPKVMCRSEEYPDGWDLPADVNVGPYWGSHKELVGRRGMDQGGGSGWRTLTYKKKQDTKLGGANWSPDKQEGRVQLSSKGAGQILKTPTPNMDRNAKREHDRPKRKRHRE